MSWYEDNAEARAYEESRLVTPVPESVPVTMTFLGVMSVAVVLWGWYVEVAVAVVK